MQYLLVLYVVFLSLWVSGQNIDHVNMDSICGINLYSNDFQNHMVEKSDIIPSLDKIKKQYPGLIACPKEYELQVFYALSHFPELKNCLIEVVEKEINHIMAAQPKISTLFRKPFKRKYFIYINNVSHDGSILAYQYEFNAQIGVFGHEISHISHYVNRNSFGIIYDGIRYVLSKKFKKGYENKTDLQTIHNGLGWQLYHNELMTYELLSHEKAVIKFIKHYYLYPREILEEIKIISQKKVGIY